MPRGCNPNSRKALEKNRQKTQFNGETAVKANAKSTEVKRKLKTFQELDAEYTTDDERKKMLDMLKKRAEQGNLRAWELYANYMGLKPAEKIAVEAIDEDTISGLKDAITKRKTNEQANER